MPQKQLFWILFLALFVAMLGAGVIAPTMPLYAKTLGASGMGLGLIYSAFSVSRAIFMPVTGKLSDRKGRKQFIVLGLTIYSLASIGYIWAGSTSELVWIRLLHGVGSAMIVPIATAAIGDAAPEGREGTMLGSFNVALFLGFGTGPLLGGVVMDILGIEEVFLLMGGLSGFSLLLILFLLPEPKGKRHRRERIPSPFSSMWKADAFKGLLIFRFSNAVVRGSTVAFLPVFAVRVAATPSQIGTLVSMNILLTAVLQHFFGRVADRWSRRGLIIGGNLLSSLPLLLTPFASDFWHLIILSFVMGVGGGVAFPAALAIATRVGRDHGMGNVMGTFNTAMSLGMITGPLIAGWIMDLLGLSVVFMWGGFLGIAGSIVCTILFFRNKGAFGYADI